MNNSVMIPKGVNDGHKGPSVNGRNPSYIRPPLAACFRCIYLISSTGDRTRIHCDAGRRNDIRSPWSCSHCRSVQVSCGHVPDGYYDISQYLLKTHENYWSLTESQRSNFRETAVQVMDLFNKLVPPMSHLESLTRATQPHNRRNLSVEAPRTLDDRAILDKVVVGLAQNTSALQELMVQLKMMNHQKDRLTSQQTHRPAEPQDERQPTQTSVANPTNGPATQMSGHQSRLSGISRSYAARIAERSQQTDLRTTSPPHQNLSGSVVSSSAHTNTGTHPSSSTDKNPHGASAQTTSNGLATPAPTRAALKSSFTPINRKSAELRARSAAAPSRTSKFSQPDSKRPREADVAATVPKRLKALQPSVNILSKGQQKAVSTAKDFQLATEAFTRAQAAIQTPETCVARAEQPSPRILGPTISKALPLHGQPEIRNLIRPLEHSGNHTAQIPSVPTEVASLPHVGLEHNAMSRSYMYSLPSIKQSSAPLHQARITLPSFEKILSSSARDLSPPLDHPESMVSPQRRLCTKFEPLVSHVSSQASKEAELHLLIGNPTPPGSPVMGSRQPTNLQVQRPPVIANSQLPLSDKTQVPAQSVVPRAAGQMDKVPVLRPQITSKTPVQMPSVDRLLSTPVSQDDHRGAPCLPEDPPVIQGCLPASSGIEETSQQHRSLSPSTPQKSAGSPSSPRRIIEPKATIRKPFGRRSWRSSDKVISSQEVLEHKRPRRLSSRAITARKSTAPPPRRLRRGLIRRESPVYDCIQVVTDAESQAPGLTRVHH